MRETIHTKVGDIDVPTLEGVGSRTKYWAEALQDLARTDQLYQVMAAALEEAYKAGKLSSLAHFMGNIKGEVIDVEAKVVCDGEEDGEADLAERYPQGSELAEPAGVDQADGSAEPPAAAAELPGSVQ